MITHPDKVLFPEDGITKGELLDYYRAVAGPVLASVANRPISLQRAPDSQTGECVYQKTAPPGLPGWIPTRRIRSEHAALGYADYVIGGDMPSLLYLLNLGYISLHPWSCSVDALDRPDELLFDLEFCYRCNWVGVREPGQRQRLVPFDPNSLPAKELLARFQALGAAAGEPHPIFYVGAESVNGGALQFFAGTTTCNETTPGNCKIVQYPRTKTATGSVSGNTITIDVNLKTGFPAAIQPSMPASITYMFLNPSSAARRAAWWLASH